MSGVFPIRLKAYFLFTEWGWVVVPVRTLQQEKREASLISHIPLLISVLFDENSFLTGSK